MGHAPFLRALGLVVIAGAVTAASADAQDLPRGEVVPDVKCAGDEGQSYALYLPPTYSPDKPWRLLMGFHPAARGRDIVETYRVAAEQYGYIVVASNTSRNGPWEVAMAALRAMSQDVVRRFSVDAEAVYLTGHSGGARVALQVALNSPNVAGVIASSAGFADSQPPTSVKFAVFMTAGIEDFNYLEMRRLDRALTSPHRLAVFDGGHTLPPVPVALEAIEWLEVQAMKAGRRPRDAALIERLLADRRRTVAAATNSLATVRLLEGLVADFRGLSDVAGEDARELALSKQPDVKKALETERADERSESRILDEVFSLEAGLSDEERRSIHLSRLRDRLSRLASAANGAEPSPERSQARRLLGAITAGARARVQDPEYRRLLDQYRFRGR